MSDIHTSKTDRYNADRSAEEKRKRRTRNDGDGRNFSCTCGKSYLSYPALYTHIKTKHNGKSEFSKVVLSREQLESVEPKEEEEVESIEKAGDSNHLELLKKYLTKFFPFTYKESKSRKELSKQDQIYIKEVKEYWQKRRKEDQAHQNETYNTTIDNIFGLFLKEMETDVSKSCLVFIYEFVINMRDSINDLKATPQFCKVNDGANLPFLMNDIFIEKFQKMEEGHLYVSHPTIICKTIFHFSRWMFYQRFTNMSLKFNTF